MLQTDRTDVREYWGVARPGAASSDAAWRIVKIVDGQPLQWADGNANLDNVWDDRESLTYSANAALTIEPAGATDAWGGFACEDIVPSLPGSTFNLGFTLPQGAVPYKDSTPMRKVGSSPGPAQYTLSGSTITCGETIDAGAWFFIRVPLA